jgi:hypothetical protein
MKTHKFLVVGFAFVSLAGCQCTSSIGDPLLTIDYDFSYTDSPDQQRLKLKVVSKSTREICLGHDFWPSSGNLTTEYWNSSGVYLFVQDRIYAYKNTDFTDYCPTKSCYNPVNMGETREAFLEYQDFGIPEKSYGLPKTLKFKPQPTWCDQGSFMN